MIEALHFLRLDVQTIRQYLTVKQLGLYAVIILVLSYTLDNAFFVMGMIMMYGLFYAAYPFAIGDKTQTDILYASLPLKKHHIIAGRYLFALCVNLVTAVLSIAISALVAVVFQKEFDLLPSIIAVLICFVLYVLVEALQFPIYFKFGYTKAKLMAFLPILFVPFSIALLTSLVQKEVWMLTLSNLFFWVEAHVLLVIIALIILLCFVIMLSAAISLRIYQKRDF